MSNSEMITREDYRRGERRKVEKGGGSRERGGGVGRQRERLNKCSKKVGE